MNSPQAYKSILAGVLLVVIAYLLTAFVTVGPGEAVVVRRLGRTLNPPWTAGLHVGLPLGFDRHERLKIDEVRRLAVGTTRLDDQVSISGRGEYLTGDRNLARVGVMIQYRVSDPIAYSLHSSDRETVLDALAERALSRSCARLGIDEILRNRRQELSGHLQTTLASDCTDLALGVELLSVNVVEARPPEEVASEFSDAQAAVSDRERRATEATTEAEQITIKARSEASKIADQASTQAVQKRNSAIRRAERFLAIFHETRGNLDQARQRLYLQAMRAGFERLGKRILLEPGQPIDLSILGAR